MKRHYLINGIFAALSLLLITACGGERYHIEGSISNAKDSVLYFEHMGLSGAEVTDSVVLDEDGTFSFSGERNVTPEFYRLRIANSIINLSIDSTETINIKADMPSMATAYEVEGSENCQKIKELSLMQIDLLNRAIAISRSTTMGIQQSEDSINSIIEDYKQTVRVNYIFKEPHMAYAYFALFQTLGSRLIFNPQESNDDIRCYAAVATAWEAHYPNSERGENLHNIAVEGLKTMRIKQQRAMGPAIDPSQIEVTNIIDVPLVDNKGRQRSLKELKGKVVLLDFHVFASPKSVERIMMLRELYNKYSALGLEIYQVSLDTDEHFWKTQTAALPWINVRDEQSLESTYLMRYNVSAIPTFFLIDRDNNLYKRDQQINDIDNEIKGLL